MTRKCEWACGWAGERDDGRHGVWRDKKSRRRAAASHAHNTHTSNLPSTLLYSEFLSFTLTHSISSSPSLSPHSPVSKTSWRIPILILRAYSPNSIMWYVSTASLPHLWQVGTPYTQAIKYDTCIGVPLCSLSVPNEACEEDVCRRQLISSELIHNFISIIKTWDLGWWCK